MTHKHGVRLSWRDRHLHRPTGHHRRHRLARVDPGRGPAGRPGPPHRHDHWCGSRRHPRPRHDPWRTRQGDRQLLTVKAARSLARPPARPTHDAPASMPRLRPVSAGGASRPRPLRPSRRTAGPPGPLPGLGVLRDRTRARSGSGAVRTDECAPDLRRRGALGPRLELKADAAPHDRAAARVPGETGAHSGSC